MHVNATQVFENTNRLFDWRDYVRQYPKGLLVAGLLTGFVLVPGRKVTPSVTLSRESMEELLAGRESISNASTGIRPALMSGVLRMMTGVAISGASILLRRGIEGFLHKKPSEASGSADKYFRRG